jgi:hypothetical protein
MALKMSRRVQELVEEAAELPPADLAALLEAIQSLRRREERIQERHAVIADRVARATAPGTATLSLEEVERSVRDDLDF